ncbi:MAG: IS110 family transposase [Mariprofundaceae bacterium]
MKKSRYIGLDVHKDFISVAVAELNGGDPYVHGQISNCATSVAKLIKKLAGEDKENELYFTYEAGCFGFILYHLITSLGYFCMVAAPSLIPRKPGDRVKTDNRDAMKLARLLRSSDLTACHVPDEADEAMRDLCRARECAVKAQRVSRQSLGGFLLRHGHVYHKDTRWTSAHINWISKIKMAHPAQQIVLQEYVLRVEHDQGRVAALKTEIMRLTPQWRWAPLVEALQTMRGVQIITAATLIAEMGDLRRFSHPRKLMAAVGLVPSEYSSGNKRKQGPITKTGNGHVRKLLTEAAWNYRFPARLTETIKRRHEGVCKEVIDISWSAQKRLCGRYQQLNLRGKDKRLVTTAVGRELCGFIWDIAQQVGLNETK